MEEYKFKMKKYVKKRNFILITELVVNVIQIVSLTIENYSKQGEIIDFNSLW